MWLLFMPPQIIVNKVSSSILLAKKIISLTDASNLVMAGDWNTTLRPLGRQGGLTWKETKYRNSLIHFIKAVNLVDIYSEMHPKNKSYT